MLQQKNKTTMKEKVHIKRSKRTLKEKLIRLSVLIIVIVLIALSMNPFLKTVYYEVESDKLSANVRVVLLSDLHSCYYGKNQHTLIDAVNKAEPDVVLLCGDIFDDGLHDTNAEILLAAISEKYPCFYVTGNHEWWRTEMKTVRDTLHKYSIRMLEGEYETITVNQQTINICGVDDPEAAIYSKDKNFAQQLEEASACTDNGNFSLLISHRPEYSSGYFMYGFDLVVSGHAHGGQWRVPGLINGIYSPDQGFFPKYAGGRYDFNNKTMIVSRGLARESTNAPRIFNRPECVVIDIIPTK